MGRSILKAAAGSLRTAPAPPACVTKASSPVPESTVSTPVPIPTRGPVTAALDALVRGAQGELGGREAEPGQHLPALALGGAAEMGFSRSGPHACPQILGAGGPWETENPTPYPWHCCQREGLLVLFCPYPTPKTASMRAGSTSLERASSLGKTPVRCASVRWVRATLRGGALWGAGTVGAEAGEWPCGQVVR